MKLAHTIAEGLARKATEKRLMPWERAFLENHLAHCPVCFRDALDLAGLAHHAAEPGLSKAKAGMLHQQVMVQIRREAGREEKESRRGALKHPAVSPLFFPALGVSALLVAFLTFLTLPPKGRVSPGTSESSVQAPANLPAPAANPANPAPVSPTAAPSAVEHGVGSR
jgi:hypothetical protein